MSTIVALLADTALPWLAQQPFPVPDPQPSLPQELNQYSDMLVGGMKAILIVAGMAGFLFGAIKISVGSADRGGLAQRGFSNVGTAMLGLMIGSIASVIVGLFVL
ncbi:hypothetical protein BAY61_32190 (plasmid) [Prauserella marina]|uniref:Uncharacterized protein n=1 Tax=Prauserella marina TaxID=530584 RepID=A0A222W162_9PSEU|nr:hypothetical protein [Prauserella marina]ASR39944.1 hypothetical protein BAY61_32190 [Prauserella marina]PWV71447.1 hypothetical protein DES30_112163 [Prauserella marina]SDD97458.1 hypothetical protein SAMN05421630_115116 [Prauserella marina]